MAHIYSSDTEDESSSDDSFILTPRPTTTGGNTENSYFNFAIGIPPGPTTSTQQGLSEELFSDQYNQHQSVASGGHDGGFSGKNRGLNL